MGNAANELERSPSLDRLLDLLPEELLRSISRKRIKEPEMISLSHVVRIVSAAVAGVMVCGAAQAGWTVNGPSLDGVTQGALNGPSLDGGRSNLHGSTNGPSLDGTQHRIPGGTNGPSIDGVQHGLALNGPSIDGGAVRVWNNGPSLDGVTRGFCNGPKLDGAQHGLMNNGPSVDGAGPGR